MNEALVSKRSGRQLFGAGEFSIIDVGNGLKVESNRRVYCRERERDRSIGHEPPSGFSSCTIGGTEQLIHTSEEQVNEHP